MQFVLSGWGHQQWPQIDGVHGFSAAFSFLECLFASHSDFPYDLYHGTYAHLVKIVLPLLPLLVPGTWYTYLPGIRYLVVGGPTGSSVSGTRMVHLLPLHSWVARKMQAKNMFWLQEFCFCSHPTRFYRGCSSKTLPFSKMFLAARNMWLPIAKHATIISKQKQIFHEKMLTL